MNIKFCIPFPEGLHARPASELVKICQTAVCQITMKKGEFEVDPKSILGIIALGAGTGEEVEFTMEGTDEEELAAKLTEFFKG
jgi:phosphocarrier protein HPr